MNYSTMTRRWGMQYACPNLCRLRAITRVRRYVVLQRQLRRLPPIQGFVGQVQGWGDPFFLDVALGGRSLPGSVEVGGSCGYFKCG